MLTSFVYTECSDRKDPLALVSNVSLVPDPIVIPGDVSLSFVGSLRREIKSPTPVSTASCHQCFMLNKFDLFFRFNFIFYFFFFLS